MKNKGVVNIRGKEYQTVALRVHNFRKDFPNYRLITSVIERTPDYVVMAAGIYNDQGVLIANGHAEESRKSSQINKTSALENCETSAIGRALASLGIGGMEFASADEVQNAIHQQEESHKPAPVDMKLRNKCEAALTKGDKLDLLAIKSKYQGKGYGEAMQSLRNSAEVKSHFDQKVSDNLKNAEAYVATACQVLQSKLNEEDHAELTVVWGELGKVGQALAGKELGRDTIDQIIQHTQENAA